MPSDLDIIKIRMGGLAAHDFSRRLKYQIKFQST